MLKKGDMVLVSKDGTHTSKNFGFDPPMKKFLGKPCVVHSFNLGGVRLESGSQWIWHESDLTKLEDDPEDIKNSIKPVIFDPQTIQEEV